MSDFWSAGEPISAAKLNRSSAATARVNYNGSGTFERSGSQWSIGESVSPQPESFWVSADEEIVVQIPIPGTSQFRSIYQYSWTECRYDPAHGFWTATGRSGTASYDPLVNYNPTQRIPLSGMAYLDPLSSTPVVETVYPVTRDPATGQLFFFS